MAFYDFQNKITTLYVAYKPLLMSGILSTSPTPLVLFYPIPNTLHRPHWHCFYFHVDFFFTLELLFLLIYPLITLLIFWHGQHFSSIMSHFRKSHPDYLPNDGFNHQPIYCPSHNPGFHPLLENQNNFVSLVIAFSRR